MGQLDATGAGRLILINVDDELNAAALDEKLLVDNPSHHRSTGGDETGTSIL